MWHGYAVTSSTLLADPPSNETIDVFYIKRGTNFLRNFKGNEFYLLSGQLSEDLAVACCLVSCRKILPSLGFILTL